jgi:hypothetical protein
LSLACAVSEAAQAESPESRLKTAGFSTRLGFWVTPDGTQVLSLADAIAGLDNGTIAPHPGHAFPDSGARALPDELVERMFQPPPPPVAPPWLLEQLTEQLRPVIRGEVRRALQAQKRKQAAKP